MALHQHGLSSELKKFKKNRKRRLAKIRRTYASNNASMQGVGRFASRATFPSKREGKNLQRGS